MPILHSDPASEQSHGEPAWRSFRVMTTREGFGVDLIEGRGTTLAEAIEHAREEIRGELEWGVTPDDRLVLEGDRLLEIVRASEVAREAEAAA